jgi:hypothetical protein
MMQCPRFARLVLQAVKFASALVVFACLLSGCELTVGRRIMWRDFYIAPGKCAELGGEPWT